MAVTLNLTDRGQSAPISTLTSTLAWIGVSTSGATPGTVDAVYEFDAPGLVNTNVGYGPGPEGCAAGVRVSQTRQVFARIAGSIPATKSAVTQSGTGPTVTLSGTPYDTATPKIKIALGGVNGVAQFQIAQDGSTYGPVLDIPAEAAAESVGTADISGITYSTLNTLTAIVTPTGGMQQTITFTGTTSMTSIVSQLNSFGKATFTSTTDISGITYSTLDTLTLIVTPSTGTTKTTTFASTTSGNFLSQINAALGSSATATLVSGQYLRITDAATGATLTISGSSTAKTILGTPTTTTTYAGFTASIVQGRYIRIVDGLSGTSSTMTIGAGTANTILGLTAGTSTGAASTFAIPYTGVTATFASGTYVLDETYSWSTVEPRFTASDIASAMTALAQKGVYFRDIVLLSNPIDGSDTRALANQVSTTLTTLRGTNPKVFAVVMMGSCTGTPSTIGANDADVKAAMQGMTDPYVCVAHGDCYMTGTVNPGSFRRPAVFSLGLREASYPISTDPGSRELPALEETSLIAPDAATLARNEDTATIKMGSSGFTVMRNEYGSAYFVQGTTRGTSPKFRYLPIMRTSVEAARVLYAGAKTYENASRFLNQNGTIREADAVAIETALNNRLFDALSTNLSNWTVTVDRAANVAVTNTLTIRADVQPLGYFYTVVINLGVVDVLQ